MESESSQTSLHICSFIKPSLSKIIDLSYSSSLSLLLVLRSPSSVQIYRLPHFLHLYSIELPSTDNPIKSIWLPPKGDILTLCSNGLLSLHQLGRTFHESRILVPGGGSTCMSYNHLDTLLIGGEDGSIRQYSLFEDDSMELEEEQEEEEEGNRNGIRRKEGGGGMEEEGSRREGGALRFLRSTRGIKGARVLSVAWGGERKEGGVRRKEDGGRRKEEIGKEFYGGYSDGQVRKFDRIGNVLVTVKLDGFAWKMEKVQEELICGCNDGRIRILETKFLSQTQELKTHEADIYALEVGRAEEAEKKEKGERREEGEGKSLFVSGGDSKIACLQKFEKGWNVVCYERGQSHDIYSLCLAGGNLLSGGVTTDICLYKLENGRFMAREGGRSTEEEVKRMEEERKTVEEGVRKEDEARKRDKLRHITGLPQEQIFFQGGDKILYKTSFKLEVWRTNYARGEYCYLAEIRSNILPITTATVSSCGNYCAYSNEEEVLVFTITNFGVEKTGVYAIQNVTLLTFLGSESLLLVDGERKVATLDFLNQGGVDRWDINILKKGEICCFNQVDVMADLVVIGGRLGNKLVVLDWRKKIVVMQIPLVMNAVGFSTFKLIGKDLVVVYENNKIAVFDTKKKCVNAWTIKNFNKFPQNFLNNYNKFIGIVQGSKSKIILYTHFSFSVVDFSVEAPSKIKRNAYNGKKPGNFDIVARDRPILFWGRTGEEEMVLVEGIWEELLRDMPGAINTKRFGN